MVVFKEERTVNSTHSCLDHVEGISIPCSSYLFECGGLSVVCLLPGITTTSLGAYEISTPHFLFLSRSKGSARTKQIL